MDAVLDEDRSVPPHAALAQYSLDAVADRYLEVLEPAA
jgi:hypothetical protein